MAAGLMRHLSAPNIHIASAGTHAKTAVNTLSAQVLAEVGVDISGHQPTQLTDQMLDDADLVVIVGSQAHLDNHPWHPHSTLGYRRTLPTRHRRHPAHANHPRRHQHPRSGPRRRAQQSIVLTEKQRRLPPHQINRGNNARVIRINTVIHERLALLSIHTHST